MTATMVYGLSRLLMDKIVDRAFAVCAFGEKIEIDVRFQQKKTEC
jgi:hypothetical protein